MGLLKKLGKTKQPKLKIRDATGLFLKINQLKEQQLLETTDQGIFYTYPEVLHLGKDPKAFCKNLYVYARNTNLLKKGDVLQIRDIEYSTILATIRADDVTLYDIKKEEKADQ